MDLKVVPLRSVLGAHVEGVNIDALEEEHEEVLRRALLEHQVLFFPEIHASVEQHKALASVFGELEVHGKKDEDHRKKEKYADDERLVTVIDSGRSPANFWHTDASFRKRPPAASCVSIQVLLERGGDTMWLDTYRAYEELSDPVKRLAESLNALHGIPGLTEFARHPVVRTHPETGRKALWVNRGWTRAIDGVAYKEGLALLEFFLATMEQPESTCRWSWSVGDIAIWDNRCTMHYALLDYGKSYREIHRVILAGDEPR